MPRKEHAVRTLVSSLYGRTSFTNLIETLKSRRVLPENAYIEYNRDDDCIDVFEVRPETAEEKTARLEKAAKQRIANKKRRDRANAETAARELAVLAKLTKKYGPLANSGQPSVATAKSPKAAKHST